MVLRSLKEADSAFEPRLANNVPFDLESSPEDTLEAEARAERDQLLDQLAMASSKLGAQHQQLAELTLEKTELQTVQVRTSGPKEEDVGNNFLDDGRGHVGEQASVQTRESLAGNSAIEATAGEPTELLQRDEIQDQSLAEDVTMQHVVDEGLVHGTGVVVEFQEGFSSDTVKDACHAVDELNSQCDGAQEVPTLECSIVTAANLRAEIQHLMDAVHAKKNEHAQALVDCDRQRFDLWQLHLNTEDLHARASELRDAQLVRGTIPSEEEEEATSRVIIHIFYVETAALTGTVTRTATHTQRTSRRGKAEDSIRQQTRADERDIKGVRRDTRLSDLASQPTSRQNMAYNWNSVFMRQVVLEVRPAPFL